MKKGIAGLFLAAVLAIVLGAVAFADDSTIVASGNCGRYGDNLTWTLDSDGLLTISGQGEMDDFVYYTGDEHESFEHVKSRWNEEKVKSVYIQDGVTSIGSGAFRNCRNLTGVTIPEGVTRIAFMAFYDCDHLTDVTIPNSVTSIEWRAFYSCGRLTDVTIPDGVTDLESSVFNGCSSLTSVMIPDSVTSIGEYAFYGCWSLTSVTIPDGVTRIEKFTFADCRELSNISIPDSVTSIGSSAFYGCYSLTDVTIPEGVTYIGYKTFMNCGSLTSVTIPNSVTGISKKAFRNCGSLTSVTIPGSVIDIESEVFKNCGRLTSVTILSGVNYIEGAAFENCSSLTSVTIPDSVTNMGLYAFSGCSNLKEIYYGGTESQWLKISSSSRILFDGVYFEGQKTAALEAVPDFLGSTGKPYIKWKAVDGAAEYKVYRSTSKTGNYKWLETTTRLNYTDTTAEMGRNYYYKVRPVGSGNVAGNKSEPVRALCHCGRPTVKSDYLPSTGKPYLTWSAVDGASKYQVYRAASKNGTYKLLGTTTKLSYTDTATNTGYTYFYKVKAVCKANSSATSAYSAAVSAISHCAKPVVRTGYVGSTGKPYLKWSTIIGASKYYVYRSSSEGGPYKYIGSTTGTS